MSRFTLGILLILGLVPLLTQADIITQTTSQATNLGLFGGEVRDVAVDEANHTIYITTYSPNGVFISTDDGAHWTGLPSDIDYGEPRGVEIDQDSGRVYALLGQGLIYSDDSGSTWTTTDAIGQYGSALLFHNDTLVVGRSDGAVSISTDHAANFTTTTIATDVSVNSLAGSPNTGQWFAVLHDGNNGTLYSTTDGGTLWNAVMTDDVADMYNAVGVDPADSDHILLVAGDEDTAPWQTYDGGATWNQTSVSGTTPIAIYFDENTGRIYAGTAYSDDNGTTWSNLETSTPLSRVSGIVVPDPTDSNTLYGASFAALAISSDGGTSWIDRNQGITAVTVRDLSQSTDKTVTWVSTGSGLAKTENFTDTNPTWEFPIYYDSYPQSVWIDPTDANYVVVGGYGGVYITTDGGTTWTTATGWSSNETAYKLAYDATNNLLYAAAGIQELGVDKTGDVYVSSDKGLSWIALEIPDSAAVQSIAIAPDGTVYAGTGIIGIQGDGATGIYKYSNSTWEQLASSPTMEIASLVIDPTDANIIYAAAAEFNSGTGSTAGLYQSIDAGETWARLTNGLDNVYRVRTVGIQAGTNTVYVAGTATDGTEAGVIYKSTDQGASWNLLYTGLSNETINYLVFDGLVSCNTRGVYEIKSKANLTIKLSDSTVTAGEQITIRTVLTDKATGKKLKHKTVSLYKKVGGSWKKVDSKKTSRQAKAQFTISVNKTAHYKVRYQPKDTAREEYIRSESNSKRARVK